MSDDLEAIDAYFDHRFQKTKAEVMSVLHQRAQEAEFVSMLSVAFNDDGVLLYIDNNHGKRMTPDEARTLGELLIKKADQYEHYKA